MGIFRRWHLAVILSLSAGLSTAQNDVRHLLRIADRSDNGATIYSYTDSGLLTREESGNSYRDFSYDADGRIIRESSWQDVKGDGNFANVYYIEYDYDTDGRMSERRNFNNYKAGGKLSLPFAISDDNPMLGDFQLGSITTYTYDDAGRLSRSDIYWDPDKTEHAQFLRYAYDNDGKLETMKQFLRRPTGNIISAEEQYRYDSKERLEEIAYFKYDTSTGTGMVQNYRIFGYSDDGNLATAGITDATRDALLTKYVYSYDKDDTKSVNYPNLPEDKENNLIYSLLKQPIYSAETFVQNQDTRELEPYAEYIYVYNGTPVESIVLSQQSLSMKEEETMILQATITPENASDQGIEWESTNPAAASVDNKGFVTAISPGETLISAVATDGSGVKTECKVTVEPKTNINDLSGENDVCVISANGCIEIQGVDTGEHYSIVDTNGRILSNGISNGNIIRTGRIQGGIYIISAAGRHFKIAVR